MKLTTACVFGSVLALSACAADGRSGDDGTGDDDGSGSGSDVPTDPQAKRCNKMDLVFVVDNSGSMAEEQGNLAQNFPQFANVLSTFVDAQGNQLDFRIALTTTGVDNTMTINFAGLPFPPMTISETGDNGKFRADCNVNRNYLDQSDPDLAGSLGCRAGVGTNGPGTEMPMIAVKKALSDRIADGTNANFVREDALLGVVILTDEDDSSSSTGMLTQTVSGTTQTMSGVDYDGPMLASFLDGFKGNRSRWSAGVIAGKTACTSSFGDATAATRLQGFVDSANSGGTQQAVFSSICDGDLTGALTEVIDQFQSACETIIL